VRKKGNVKEGVGGTEVPENIKDRSMLPFSEYIKRGQTTFFRKRRPILIDSDNPNRVTGGF
jgi:hypothetical protein